MKWALKEANLEVKSITATEGGFLILAPDEESQMAMEGLSGLMLGERTVQITRTQVKMTGDEILEWMGEQLRIQEQAAECIALQERPSHRLGF